MGIIMFNGTSSKDLHALVQFAPGYEFPEKDYNVTHVEGRNGDIILDTGSWKNVKRTYNLAIDARRVSYTEVASKLVQWLHSASGYARLEDSYEPDFYRMATYKDEGTISNILSKAGQIEITFECKPQRFLKSGEVTDIFTMNMDYRNPTDFPSEPLIVVHGTGAGSIKIGDYEITLHGLVDGMIIDCDKKDVYFNTFNLNSLVTIREFPKLISGNNYISMSGGVTSVEIKPRWWML